MEVHLWVCATPGCDTYFGSSSIHGVDLSSKLNYPATQDGGMSKGSTGNRSQCPSCKKPRQRLTVTVRKPSPVDQLAAA